jgi:hypothetical protein
MIDKRIIVYCTRRGKNRIKYVADLHRLKSKTIGKTFHFHKHTLLK